MKKLRHAMIVELIEKEVIETQEELAERLKSAGFDVTQATVSRDIRDLKLTKVTLDDGKQKYVLIKEKNKADLPELAQAWAWAQVSVRQWLARWRA